MRVGFIGLGLMGGPMAQNLLKAGHSLVVWNRTPDRARPLVEAGARALASPAEVAREAEVVVSIVTDAPAVEEVYLGPQGVGEGASPGLLAIDMSTISPETARRVGERLAGKGVDFLDAPVSGGVWGAQQGTLSIMVGGKREAYEKALPLLQVMGKRIVYCGPSGMGQLTKLVNQVIVAGTLASVCEGLALAAAAGADLRAVFQAVTGGAANSWQLENLGARILKGDFAPGFKVAHQRKDLTYALETARSLGLPLFTTPLIHQVYTALEREGLGEEGTQAYIKFLEQLAGVQARAPEGP